MPLESPRGQFSLQVEVPDGPPKSVIVLGSGDGGWSGWEKRVSRWLAEEGHLVAGFDCAQYAYQDYTRAELVADFARAALRARSAAGAGSLPVIYAGWSMGAAQAVAAASDPLGRDPQVVGLLLFSADARGRYGLRGSDQVGLSPTGPGTFSLRDFEPYLEGLRIVQFHGTADLLGDTDWIRGLREPSRLILAPGANHGFDGPSDGMRELFLAGVAWGLDPGATGYAAVDKGGTPWLAPLALFLAIAVTLAIVGLAWKPAGVRLVPLALGFMGLVQLVQALEPPILAALSPWLPLQAAGGDRWLSAAAGVALLLLSRGLLRRKRVVWWITLGLLALASVVHWVDGLRWHHSLVLVLLMLPLLRWEGWYLASTDRRSLRIGVGATVLGLLLVLFQGSLRLPGETGQGWGRSLATSLEAVLQGHPEIGDLHRGQVGKRLEELRLEGLLVGLIGLVFALRPVASVPGKDEREAERCRARGILERHGRDPMDAFVLLEDKRYHFPEGIDGVVAYSVWQGCAVALADPVGPADQRETILRSFAAHCRRNDWHPVFYCVHETNRNLYQKNGYNLLRIGEDARLDLGIFRLEGIRFQNLRTARNKARRNGLVCRRTAPGEAVPEEKLGQMAEISRAWLERKRIGELTFDLGAFSPEAIRGSGVAWAERADGRVEAFATWHPYLGGTGRSLDLMRGRVEARDVIDFLIVECLDGFREEGIVEVSLGNAPLANLGAVDRRRDRAVRYLYENFDRFYGYKRLFAFKQKYQPDWQARYLAYPPDVVLVKAGMAVAGVHLPRGLLGLVKPRPAAAGP